MNHQLIRRLANLFTIAYAFQDVNFFNYIFPSERSDYGKTNNLKVMINCSSKSLSRCLAQINSYCDLKKKAVNKNKMQNI